MADNDKFKYDKNNTKTESKKELKSGDGKEQEKSAEFDIDDERTALSEIEIDSDAETISMVLPSSADLNPPDVPPFVDRLMIGDLPLIARERLKFELDLPSVGEALKNWQWLASYFGLNWSEIKYLEERVVYPHSPTLEVLWRFKEENLGHLLRLIRDKLRRYGLIIQLIPILKEELLNNQRKKSAGSHLENYATTLDCEDEGATSSSNIDSGIVKSEPSQSSRPDSENSACSVKCKWHWAELCTSNKQFKKNSSQNGVVVNGVASASNFPPATSSDECVNNRNEPWNSLSKEFNVFEDSPKVKVLLTFYKESETHTRYVRWFENNLTKHGAYVIKYNDLGASAYWNLTAALEKAFKEADKIVVILSNGYTEIVESVGTCDSGQPKNDGERDALSLCYLYSQMNAEYMQNNCVNLRFSPVVFSSSSCLKVPPLFRNTLVFSWPSMHHELFNLIFEKARTFGNNRSDADNYSLASF